MPLFKSQTAFEVTRSLKAFLRLEARLSRKETTDLLERPGWSLTGPGRLDELSEPVREAVLNLGDEVDLAAKSAVSAERLRKLAGPKDLKLHLGAGGDIKVGWVNLDLAFKPSPKRRRARSDQDTVLVEYDLRRGLPLPAESCDYIYSSHFFEHLEYRDGLRLMRDCHRSLRPGGIFRVALPTFKGLFSRYLQADEEAGLSPALSGQILRLLPDLEPGTETMVDWINYGVYQRGEHRYIYDEEKVILLLQRIGYSSVEESQYEEGMDPDTEARRKYSFYVQAVK